MEDDLFESEHEDWMSYMFEYAGGYWPEIYDDDEPYIDIEQEIHDQRDIYSFHSLLNTLNEYNRKGEHDE